MSRADAANLTLTDLPQSHPATVSRVDWAALTAPEARRLREFGLDEGVEVEMLQPSGLLGGPISARIGRMTVALRRHIGDAIHVGAA